MKRLPKLLIVPWLLLAAGTCLFARGAAEGPTTSKERMEITWIGHPHVLTEPAPADGNYAELLIEARFNVDIKPVPINLSDTEKLMLYFAEGKSADHVMVKDGASFRKLADQGLIRSVPKEWMYQSMPESMRRVGSFFGKELMEDAIVYNGKTWGAPLLNYGHKVPSIPVARQDWMDAVGMPKAPETLVEFEELIKRFTRNDPDGNGKADTYGIHDYGLRFPTVFGAYGILSNSFYLRNATVVSSLVMEEYRTALGLLQKWYAAGYIDPEVVTDDRTKERNKWSVGRFGILHDAPSWLFHGTPQNIVDMLTAKNPKARIALLPAPKGPGGLSGSRVPYPDYLSAGAIFYGAKTADAKVRKIMEIAEGITTDRSLWVQLWDGKEGVHWDTVAGVTVYRSDVTNARRAADGLGQFYATIPILLSDVKTISLVDMATMDFALRIPPIFDGKEAGVTFPISGTSTVWKERGADINTIFTEYYWKVITGKANLAADWDAYVANLRKAGLEEVTADFQRLNKAIVR